MRLPRASFVLTILTLVGNVGNAQEAPPKKPAVRLTPEVIAIRKAKPSVVCLKVTRSSAYSTREIVGSGVIVDKRGVVVTNRHVVTGSGGVKAVTFDGTEYEAKVVLEDARHDLAILQLSIKSELKAIEFAPSSDLEQGEKVLAYGNPYGYVGTVSEGIVSALNREITMPTGEKLSGLIQVTAAINPGNSGGALLNLEGKLIGINVAMRDGAQGIAFALNADMVQEVLAQHLRAANVSGVEHGLACREELANTAEESRCKVVVESAKQDAMKRGDVIVAVDQQKVTNRFELERSLWGHKVGDVVAVKVVRDGKEMQVSLTLAEGRVASADTTPRQGRAEVVRPVGDR